LAITVLSLACDVRAEGDPVLVLSLVDALALFERPAATEKPSAPVASARWRDPAPGATPPPPAFIPRRIHIPNLYRVDVERDAPRFAEPVDNDRMVKFEMMPSGRARPSLSFIYDTESLPIGDKSDRVSVQLELPF
jgi:hypothetical protein